MKSVRLSALLLAVAVLSGPAIGQVSTNQGGPIQIDSDELELIPDQNLALFTRNVVVVQGPSVLRTNNLRVLYRGGANGAVPGNQSEIDKIYADSEVFYSTPQERARGDRAVYDAATDLVTITGNVVLTRGDDVLKGDVLTIQQRTRRTVMKSNNGNKERVRAVIFPASGG